MSSTTAPKESAPNLRETLTYAAVNSQMVARLGMEQFMQVVDARGALTRYPKFRWLFRMFNAFASAGFIALPAYRLGSGMGGK